MKPECKKIDLVVSNKNVKIKASKIIREYVNRPYSELIAAVENSEPLFTAELVPEQFYDGIKVVVSVMSSLEKEKVPYSIFINGELETKEAVLKLENKVGGLTLQDFR